MTTVQAPPTPPHTREPEIDAGVIEEARRRQRRQWWVAAVVLIVIAAALALGLKFGSNSPTPPSGARGRPADGAGAATTTRVPGAHTTLLTWPAGKAVFGDLPGGGPGTTVRITKLDTGRSTVGRIPRIAGGDFPYTLTSVGPWLVFNSDRGVAAIRTDLRGPERILGRAVWFVPGTHGHVWLISADNAAAEPRSVREVDVSKGTQSPLVRLPHDTVDVIRGTTRGLLLIARGPGRDQLELWRPRAPPVALTPPGFGAENVFATTPNSATYGSRCTDVSRPSGSELVCDRLTVVDLRSGDRRSVTAPAGTRGWMPPLDVMMGASSLSPDGRYLAARAALPPAGGERARLYLVGLRGAASSTIPVPDSNAPFNAQMAWSISGNWLTYQTANRRLRAWRPGSRPRTLNFPCCGATMLAVP